MKENLSSFGLEIHNGLLKSQEVSIPIGNIKSIMVQSGGHMTMRVITVLGGISFAILSSWTGIGPVLAFIPILWAILCPPSNVILKTVEGDIVVYSSLGFFGFPPPEKNAKELKAILENEVFN